MATADAVDEAFFNDLSRQAPTRSETEPSLDNNDTACDSENQPRAKRIACVLCRKRKLRCDGARPKCGTCARLSHECGYDEVRKKSGPKRGYVKQLEQRLQQVETLLKTQDKPEQPPQRQHQSASPAHSENLNLAGREPIQDDLSELPPKTAPDAFSWEMIGLGLEEPLPVQDAVNELHTLFFAKLHPSVPMIHRPRYLAAMNLAPHMRPPVCLRYIIWTLAAATSDKYSSLAPEFYKRARKYAEVDEMKGNGEAMITLAHAQAWLLIAWYEFKNMYFPRAWQSTGRAASLASMMGLNRLDGAILDVKQCLPPPKDWTEKEERRRTFWMCFCADRYASIGTGWAHRLDEQDIMTVLPASDDAFDKSRPMVAPSLEQAFLSSASTNVSAIGAVIMIACLLGRNLTHLHRPEPNDNEEDLNGAFWQRHRKLENILSNIALSMPDHLRIPEGLPDPNVIFMNMLLHTSVICLHQAAIFKADRNRLPQNIINESRTRCLAGAGEITRIMKMMSHLDLSATNPFMSFCLYVAARVFVQYLKWRPKDQSMIASLHFLGSAMHALSRKNPLTESFMAQLEVDLEGTGINLGSRPSMWSVPTAFQHDKIKGFKGIIPEYHEENVPSRSKVPSEIPVNTDAVKCAPIFELRDSQSAGLANNNHIFHPQTTQSAPQSFNANMTVDPSYNHMATNDPMQFPLPSRSKDSPFAQQSMYPMDRIHAMSASDMDFSRDSSVAKSRSNSSFTPTDSSDQTPPSFGVSAGLPKSPSSAMPTPGTGGGADFMFFEVPDHVFQVTQPQLFAPFGTGAQELAVSSAWDMTGMEGTSTSGTSTGLTPMADSAWSEIYSATSGSDGMMGVRPGNVGSGV